MLVVHGISLIRPHDIAADRDRVMLLVDVAGIRRQVSRHISENKETTPRLVAEMLRSMAEELDQAPS